MIATAGTANATCRTTKYQLQWNRGLTAAIIDDALYSMTTPKHASNRTVANRIQSAFRRCDMLFLGLQAVDDLLENFPAMLVTAELVEARARRRERSGLDQRHGAVERCGDLGRCRADQQHAARLGGQRFAKQSVVQPLVLTAEDDPHAALERVERLERRVHAGRLRRSTRSSAACGSSSAV